MIILNNKSNVPLYLQIYEQLKKDIISGELSEGNKLPSTRKLSVDLNVSRNTIESAYMQLSSEGYILSKAGSGFIIQKFDNSIVSKLNKDYIELVENTLSTKNSDNNYKYNFECACLSAEDFPLTLWKRISNKCLTSISAKNMTSYSTSKGELELRIEIMKYLKKSRGVSCTLEQIIITSGMEYCLSLLCQLFGEDFNEIALEDPGYIGAKDIFINNRYAVTPISLEEDGINIDELEKSSSRIVYVTPSHQFPTGSVMPIAKRLKLLDWAMRKNAIIIEDDYDSELRYNSKPIPSIQSIDSTGSVIYIGTFSKALSPSLRLNYMVLPKLWLEKYDKYFIKYQSSVPIVQQKIIQQFMYMGHWDTHLRKINLVNKRKHDLLIHAIQELIGDNIIIHTKNAGLHILLESNNGLTERDLIAKAKDYGVKIYPVSIFWANENKYSNNMVMLGFGAISENDIVEGVKLLKKAWSL